VTRARGFHVFDGLREHLGSFQTFHAAHDWAHLQAALGGVATPVEIEDRARRVTRQITRDGCETVVWRSTGPGHAPAADEASGATADRPAPDSQESDHEPDCAAPGGTDAATSLRVAADRFPDAYRPDGGPPLPRAPLDAEITGVRRKG
jgi:hypothetical protein